MKKFLLLILFFITVTILVNAQDTTSTKKKHNNEFGIDITTILRQTLFVYDPVMYQYTAAYYPYYITYRRHLECGNIRFAIGGSFEDHDVSYYYNFIEELPPGMKYQTYSIGTRLGWEFCEELNKRWQFFYGLDFHFVYDHTENDLSGNYNSYYRGLESKSYNKGLAPFLGVRLRLTKRLSLLTEARFAINWEQNEIREYYTPYNDTIAPKADIGPIKSKKIEGGFSQPLTVYMTFDI